MGHATPEFRGCGVYVCKRRVNFVNARVYYTYGIRVNFVNALVYIVDTLLTAVNRPNMRRRAVTLRQETTTNG